MKNLDKHINKYNIIGKKFNRLTVVSFSHKSLANGNLFWNCICECGNKTVVKGTNIKYGYTKSCGCLCNDVQVKLLNKYVNENIKLPPGVAAGNALYSDYKHGAKKRNLVFDLSKESFFKIVKNDCFYCGLQPSSIFKNTTSNGSYTYNGVDRIDSSKGYLESNVVTCCKICNYAKRSLSLNDFINWIKRVYCNIIKLEGIINE